MNIKKIEKIVGYICVAIMTIAVAAFLKDLLGTIAVALIGFYFVSGDHKKDE